MRTFTRSGKKPAFTFSFSAQEISFHFAERKDIRARDDIVFFAISAEKQAIL